MFSILWNLLAFLIAIGILVTVHEFGHFWVARRCGVHVERFCIGFGHTLWSRFDRHGTEYVIAMIPLGGYVKMLDKQARLVTSTHYFYQAFNNKPIWQRAAIVSAGPVTNFLFAILAYWLVFIIGVPTIRPVVGGIMPQSIAAQAEISPGMELKSIDGIKTTDWESVRLALIAKIGDRQTKISIASFGSSQQVIKSLDLRRWNLEPYKEDPITTLGIIPLIPQIESVVAEVQPDSAAQKAGLHVGDRIIKINDHQLDNWQTFVKQIHNSPEKPLDLEIERNGLPLFLTIIPYKKAMGKGKVVGFAGIIPKVLPLSEEYKTIKQYGWLPALYQASEKTFYLMRFTVSMLGKLIIGDVKLINISGPISIAQGAATSAESGLVYYLMFLALISINLGIINLFPFPVLDGGHLLFLTIEKFKGRPVPEKLQDYSYRMGSIMLGLLMGLALFNDFSRLYGRG